MSTLILEMLEILRISWITALLKVPSVTKDLTDL